jgi:hypothetical protein
MLLFSSGQPPGHQYFHGSIHQVGGVEQIKAVNQNLMHANLSITDGVYGILSGMDVKGETLEMRVSLAK